MQNRIFYLICFGFIGGVLLRTFFPINMFTALWLGGIAFSLIFLYLIIKNRWLVIIGVFAFAISIGILRYSFTEFATFDIYDPGDEIVSEGVIIDDPDIRATNQGLVVEENISGMITKILVTTDLGEEFKYGDMVSFSGEIEKPENFTTDQGKEFDYVNYLKKDGILSIVNFAEVEVISQGHGNPVKTALFEIKHIFLDKISSAIREPESLLMGGLILGERSAFSQDLRQKFIDTGTIHIIALSGYNVTIVAEWIMKIFAFLPRNLGFGAGILGILLFVVMAGAGSTAIRAGIMASLALVARATGRDYDVARALVLAGVGMVLINPLILVYDVSFQLSFIATVAVIFLAPKIEKYFLWITPKFGLQDVVSVTFAAYIFVLPFILYKIGNLSLVALPANILILPFIPFTMLLGFLTGFLGLIHYALAVPVAFLSYFLLHYELSVIDLFSSFPYALFSIPDFPLILTILIYAYFIYRLFGRSIQKFFSNPE